MQRGFAARVFRSGTGMRSHDFYCTFGTGHPGFPGYCIVSAEGETDNELEADASRNMRAVFGGRWCRMYWTFEELHELDRVFRDRI